VNIHPQTKIDIVLVIIMIALLAIAAIIERSGAAQTIQSFFAAL
jgi:hypothetical protein